MALHLETLFPAELERHLALAPVLVLPFGTIEWHSHHLPLGLDGLVAARMGQEMAERMNAVLAPTGYWAVGGVPFPFTFNLPIHPVESLLATTFTQSAAMGFQILVAFTGHFGLDQTLAIKRAALLAMRQTDGIVLPLTTYDLVTNFYGGDHAGIGETSLMMALRPDLVRLDAWPANEALPGVIGDDPRPCATPDLGRRILDESAVRAADLVAGFRAGKLDRDAWIATLTLMVEALALTQAMRRTMPKTDVPPVTTPDYLRACDAMAHGQFADAQAFLRTKITALHRVHA